METLRRLLLVEDDPLTANYLRRSLGSACEVVPVKSHDEAMLVLASQRFDAVLSDYHLAGERTGCHVLREVHQRAPSLRRVLLTASTAECAFAHFILRKPATTRDLLDALFL